MNNPVGKYSILRKVKIGRGSKIWHFCNLYECTIGSNTQIASYCEIRKGVVIGSNCRLQSSILMGDYTKIGHYVYIGLGVIFCNDKYPTACKVNDWKCEPVVVDDYVTIGSGAIILPGVHIGTNTLVGAGSVVTKDVPAYSVCYGSPARIVGSTTDEKYKDLIF